MKMNNILLIDDRQDFADGFLLESASKSITVIHRKSFDGLKEFLPRYQFKLAAVVLDIRCLVKDEQQKEDASFITVALKYLDQNVPGFPRFVLTGDDKEFEKFRGYFTDERVFLKTPQDLEKLFIELEHCIANSEILGIKRENRSVFEIFETGKMNDTAELLLIQILKDGLSEKEYGKFKGVLANVRSMQESIYKSINQRNKKVVFDSMFKPNGMLKFYELMKHLDGYPDARGNSTQVIYQNRTISQLANCLYWSCGEYIHEDPNRNYFISTYTVKSLINGLSELIIWSKQY